MPDNRDRDFYRNRGSQLKAIPIAGKYFKDPYQSLAAETFEQAGRGIDRYRAALPEGYANAWKNTAQVYQPMNDAIGRIYGNQSQINMSGMQPVITPGMLAVGAGSVDDIADEEQWADQPALSRRQRRQKRRQDRRQGRRDRRQARRDRAMAGPPGQQGG